MKPNHQQSNGLQLHQGRRNFLKISAGITAGCSIGLPSWAIDCTNTHPGNELRLPPSWNNGDDLIVAPGALEIFPGNQTSVLAINGAVPGPTIHLTRGDTFNARVVNNLNNPLVLHWHGLLAPERQDGHPRDQVAAGESYDISYKINQRGSTCWYHSHTNHLTAEQVYMGLAGFFIIDDPEHDALGLPAGDHDIPLVISDWRSNANFEFTYTPGNPDLMRGYLGDTPLINGTPEAYLCVDQNLHRFRILNGSTARIYKLAFSDGRSFQLIGSDGGLLSAPVPVTNAVLAPGQRLEILVDFGNISVGNSVTLISLGVPLDAGPSNPAQNNTFHLMTFYVEQASSVATPPTALIPITPLVAADAVVSRSFVISNSGTTHYIDGQLFELERVDFEPTQGKLELWEYQNTGNVYHPMHMHAAHCQVLERVGGSLLPEDAGWKDTVLIYPNETVRLLVRFDHHPGKFLHHCHNLEHEDNGMMQNFEILPFANADLQINFTGTSYEISWLVDASGALESTPDLSTDSWQPIAQTPILVNGRQTLTLPATGNQTFFRLALR